MRCPVLAILTISGPAAALLSSSVATQRGHDSDVVLRGEPNQVPDDARLLRPRRIPLQLVMTAKKGGLDDLPKRQRANVERTLALNPDLVVRFLNDTACSEFIERHFGDELANRFKNESVGYFRGDICRAAVIAIEGGFYADLDVQFKVPFSEMVDGGTTFMSAFDSFCQMWNAVFAAEPNSDVMHAVIDAMKSWYKSNSGGLMGTKTFYDGLDYIVKRDCLNHCKGTKNCGDLHFKARRKLQFPCGPKNTFRFYREMPLDCGSKLKARDPEECPDTRAHGFWGLRFGIYEPGKEGSHGPGKLVGWSRYEDCTNFGCNQRRSAPPPSNDTNTQRHLDSGEYNPSANMYDDNGERHPSHCP